MPLYGSNSNPAHRGKLCISGPLTKNYNKTSSFASIPFPLCVSVKVDGRYIEMKCNAFIFTRSDAKLIFIVLSNLSNLRDMGVKRTL